MNKFERLERLVGTSMVNSFKNEKILVVGISYDKETKKHHCKVEGI